MKLASIFTDRMVLQANKPIRVFGKGCGKGKIVFLGKEYCFTSDEENWCVELEESNYGGPYEMEVILENKKELLRDIYIGEVWLASGQSNMEMPLFRTEGGFSDAKLADNDLIRFFTVPRRTEKNTVSHGWHFEKTMSTDTPWMICNEESALHFSAIGFYTAQRLQRELGVAIGIISCNWGGIKIESFIERKYFYESEFLLPMIKQYEELTRITSETEEQKAFDNYLKEFKSYYEEIDYDELEQTRNIGIYSTNSYDKNPPMLNNCKYSPNAPGCLFESMFKRITPYSVKGVLWYQGESNECFGYAEKYMIFMKCIRENFNDPSIVFYAVELSMWHGGKEHIDGRFVEENEENWAFRREQQYLATKLNDKNFLITNMDLGEIYDIHPKRKSELSRRMALKILKYTYGVEILADEPRYISYETIGNKMRIKFSNADGLFSRRLNDVKMYIADSSKKLERANIEISGDTLILYSEKVEKPTMARFAFDMCYLGAHIYNKAGLPIAPFRTDNNRNEQSF